LSIKNGEVQTEEFLLASWRGNHRPTFLSAAGRN